MRRKVIPISRPKVIVKKKEVKDLPVISNFLGSQPIYVKEDFLRLVAESYGKTYSDKIYELTVYYNVLAAVFGADTLEVCYTDINGKERVIKKLSIEEKLSAREQEMIDYIRGFIKYAEDRSWYKSSRRNSKKTLNKLLKYFINDRLNRKKGEWRIETLTEKFPEVKLHRGRLYVYNFNGYVDYRDARKKNNSSAPSLVSIPLSHQYKQILELSKQDLSEAKLDGYDAFQRECFRSISSKKDPLSVFIKSNFIKSPKSDTQSTPLDDSEIRLIAGFLKSAGIGTTHNVSTTNISRESFYSDVSNAVVLSNFKKIKLECVINGQEKINLRSIKINLVKTNAKSDEVVFTLSCDKAVDSSLKYRRVQKVSNLGSFPTQYARRDNPGLKESFITRNQLYDQSLKVYSCNRAVSEDEENNSGFSQFDISKKPDTEVVVDSNGKLNLNRDIIFNVNSGEYAVNSTVKLNLERADKSTYSPPVSEDRMNNIKLFSFCISNKENNFPVNLLKLENIPENVRISRVFCRPEIGSLGFDIPFTRGTSEILHGDPLPGVRYTYQISFIDYYGKKYNQFLETKVRTLPAAPKNILLEDLGKYTHTDRSVYLKVGLAKSILSNYASDISKSLDQVFKSKARDFYTDQFKTKLNENLQNIGQTFEIFVSYFSKEDGELIESRFIEASTLEEFNNDGNLYFLLPLDTSLENMIISYNLIITNPIDIVTIEETFKDKETKKAFIKDTSKFFSTVGKISGTVPVAAEDPDTGDVVYKTSSRIPVNSKLSRLVCCGGIAESNNEVSKSMHLVNNLKGLYFPDDGDFVLRWDVRARVNSFEKNTHIDFFIITAIINGLEIPITAYPFLGFTRYKMRTFSFLGAASKVSFKIYPVYNDFKVDIEGIAKSPIYRVRDIRVQGNKVL